MQPLKPLHQHRAWANEESDWLRWMREVHLPEVLATQHAAGLQAEHAARFGGRASATRSLLRSLQNRGNVS